MRLFLKPYYELEVDNVESSDAWSSIKLTLSQEGDGWQFGKLLEWKQINGVGLNDSWNFQFSPANCS